MKIACQNGDISIPTRYGGRYYPFPCTYSKPLIMREICNSVPPRTCTIEKLAFFFAGNMKLSYVKIKHFCHLLIVNDFKKRSLAGCPLSHDAVQLKYCMVSMIEFMKESGNNYFFILCKRYNQSTYTT